MDFGSALFYFLAAIILLFSFRTITAPNPIMSALNLVVTMITLAGMFFMLNAQFIAGVQLIVYAGAVMVLFVIVLMLFDLKTEVRAFSRGAISGMLKLFSAVGIGGLVIGAVVMSTDLLSSGATNTPAAAGTTKDLALLLFSKYLFAFEALGLLLLLIAVGVVAVSRIKGGTHARH